MRKILAMGASVAMFFATSAPVFAHGGPGGPHPTPPTTNTNVIDFHGNDLHVYANSGKNLELGLVGTGVIYGFAGPITNTGGLTQRLTTGDAGATGQQIVQLSPTCTGCQNTTNVVTFKHNDLYVGANTGKNALLGGVVTGAYHSSTGGVTNTGAVSQTLTTGGAGAVGNQWVITGLTTM